MSISETYNRWHSIGCRPLLFTIMMLFIVFCAISIELHYVIVSMHLSIYYKAARIEKSCPLAYTPPSP